MTFLDQPRGRPMGAIDALLAIERREPGFGEFIGLVGEETFATGPLIALTLPPLSSEQMAERFSSIVETRRRLGFGLSDQTVANLSRGFFPISEEEWRTGPHFREGIEWDEGMTEARAEAIAEAHDAMNLRRAIMANRDVGFFDGTAALATALVVSALDPVNYIPFVGPAARARAIARFGPIGGRILVGAGDNAIGTAVIQPLLINNRLAIGDDVGWQDAALDIAIGTAVGAVFGGTAGVLSRRAGRSADRRTAVNATGRVIEAADAIARDEPIDIGATPGRLIDGVDRALSRADQADANLMAQQRGERSDPWPGTTDMPERRLFLEPRDDADVVRFRDLSLETPGARLQLSLGRLPRVVTDFVARQMNIDIRRGRHSVVLEQADVRAIEGRRTNARRRTGRRVSDDDWRDLTTVLHNPEGIDVNPANPRRSVFIRGRSADGQPLVIEAVINRPARGDPTVRIVDFRRPGNAQHRIPRRPLADASARARPMPPRRHLARADTKAAPPDRVTSVAEESGDDVGEILENDLGVDADIARLEAAGRVTREDRAALEAAKALAARSRRYEQAYDAAATCIIGKAV